MIRVLLDTDVVLDVLADRHPFVVEAAVIWLANEQGRLEAWVSPITPVNVFYIMRRQFGAVATRQAVGHLLAKVQICPLDHAMTQTAYALPMPDFEDAMQAAAAHAAGLDALVTRNVSDYANAPLPVLTPADVVNMLATP